MKATATLTEKKARDVVKRAMFLAWQACGGALGNGIFQDRGPGMTEAQVWEQLVEKGDYSGGNAFGQRNTDEADQGDVYGDYVFGRMMKVGYSWSDGDRINYYHDDKLTLDYQAWCGRYPTHQALLDAAAGELGLTPTHSIS